MNVGALGHGSFDCGGLDLAVLSRKQQDLGAVRKKFRRPAFRNFYVRDLVAKNAVVRLAERRERQRIGRCAVEYQEHFTLRFEDVADETGRLRGPRVVAITDFMSSVSLRERCEGFGANASVVVAGEMAGFRIFLHVLPEVLTELAGLFASSSIGNVIHVIAILAIHQVHQASPVPRSACERGSTKQILIERYGADVRLPDL